MIRFKQFLSEKKYNKNKFDSDIESLRSMYEHKFHGNQKTIDQLKNLLLTCEATEQKEIMEELEWEEDQFNQIIRNSRIENTNESRMLYITKWIANNGIDPEKHFAPNAEFRHKNILGKLQIESCKFGEDEITRQELKTLESVLDKLFEGLGIDIEFTRHFHDRVNDARNKKQITLCELSNIFQSLYRKYGTQLTKEPDEIEELIKSISTNINIPVVLEWNFRSKKIELIAKTVMRKKNFKTRDKVLRVE